MKLSYRGVAYDSSSSLVEMAKSRISCRYRGATYTQTYPRPIPIPQTVLTLAYRGVEYCTDGSIPASQVCANPTMHSAPIPVPPSFQVRQSLRQQVEQIHRENIRRSAERRLAAAQASGNQNLVQALEAELQQFA